MKTMRPQWEMWAAVTVAMAAVIAGACRPAGGVLGSACASVEDCESGHCSAGVCCDSECDEPCYDCGADGHCAPVISGQEDFDSFLMCLNPYVCDGNGNCIDGSVLNTCTTPDECGTGFCVSGICCESACQEPCMRCAGPGGTCTHFVAEGSPDYDANPPCVGDSACDGNGVCLVMDGATCGSGSECISGFCVDGVCCESACDTPCMNCENPLGTCTSFVPDGDQDPGANPPCDGNYHCNGAGDCEEIGLAPGSACVDASECESGHCENSTCCMDACALPCMLCNNPQGTCTTFVPPFTEVPGQCEAPTVCDGAGNCCEYQVHDTQQLPVDIIFVIDNSGSMGNEITAVQDNININFAAIIAATGLDYRVIMLSRHGEDVGPESICIEAPLSGIPAGGCSPPPVQPVNTSTFYHYSIEVSSGDSFCQVLDRFNTPDEFNLAPGGYSQWLRVNAYKVFIEITDDGVGCTSVTGQESYHDNNTITDGNVTATNFDTALLALSPTHFGSPADRNYVWYSIVCLANQAPPTDPWLPTDPITTSECSPQNCSAPGTGYQALSRLTGGLRFPLCQYSAFDVVFNDIATAVVYMGCMYYIPHNVNPSAVNLQYTPSVGPPELWAQVPNVATCTGDQWYLDNPANPSMILLCPDACSRAQGDVGSQVEVLACVLH